MAKKMLIGRIEGDQALKDKLDQLGKRGRVALLPAARAGAAIIEDAAELLAPGPHIITGNEKTEGGMAEIEIGPDEEHWAYRFIEFGATDHEIKGNPLVFEGDSGLVITRRVNHPGLTARPFLRPAADRNKKEVSEAAGKVFKSEIAKLVIDGND